MAKASETLNKIEVPLDERPRCTHRGCNEPAQHTGNYSKAGYPFFRKLCSVHHSKKIAKRHGMKSLAEVVAAKQGLTVTEYQNKNHPYRKHRKEYCENRDGTILGFKCRYKIRHSAQLQVDHINGNPHDHRPENLQTLCCNCHAYKTHANKDYATPGRKTLKGMFTKLI